MAQWTFLCRHTRQCITSQDDVYSVQLGPDLQRFLRQSYERVTT